MLRRLCVSVLVAACSGRPAVTPPRQPATEGPPAAPEVAAPPPSRPAPAVVLSAEVAAGSVALVLEQRDARLVRLKTAVVVERGDGDRFVPFPAALLSLRSSCERSPPACIALAPGAELHPPAWPKAGSQCALDGTPLARGRYRFVAAACDGTYRIDGEPFVIE